MLSLREEGPKTQTQESHKQIQANHKDHTFLYLTVKKAFHYFSAHKKPIKPAKLPNYIYRGNQNGNHLINLLGERFSTYSHLNRKMITSNEKCYLMKSLHSYNATGKYRA